MNPRSSRYVPTRGLRRSFAAVALFAAVGLAACGSDDASSDSGATTAAPAAGDESSSSSPSSPSSPSSQSSSVSSVSPALIDPAAVEALLTAPPAGLVVLDVRTPEEFAAGHLEGAVDIDFQSATFAADVAAVGLDTPVLVYCHSGNRSAQAVAAMVQFGFTDITELDGGIVAWEAAGLRLV